MEALPRGRRNGWKLMTTGGAARAQVLDSCLLIVPPAEKNAIPLFEKNDLN